MSVTRFPVQVNSKILIGLIINIVNPVMINNTSTVINARINIVIDIEVSILIHF